jgi:hypothetical protein
VQAEWQVEQVENGVGQRFHKIKTQTSLRAHAHNRPEGICYCAWNLDALLCFEVRLCVMMGDNIGTGIIVPFILNRIKEYSFLWLCELPARVLTTEE